LLLLESLFTAAALAVLSGAGLLNIKGFSRRICTLLPIVTAAKAGNMYFSFQTMAHTSLPVYNVLKRLNPVFSLVLDWAIRRAKPTVGVLLGVLFIALGAIVTSQGDLDFELYGYTVAIVAAFCQALYLVLAKQIGDQLALSQWDLLFFTAVFNSFLFLPMTNAELEPLAAWWAKNQGEALQHLSTLCGYILLGASLNYVTFWSTKLNSPTTVGVSGNFKGVLSTAFGIVWFGTKLTPVGWLGLTLSALGGLIYSLEKARKKPAVKDAKKKA